jgi:cephalosporin hydroxylase
MINWMRSATFNVVDLCEYLKIAGTPQLIMYEIGSAAGESAEVFARYFGEVHCVDPWPFPAATDDVERSFDERAALCGNILKHRALSLAIAPLVADDSLDFVYIDADHNYDAVLADIRAWLSKVHARAFIGGHDYDLPDVQRAVADGLEIEPRLFSDHSWVIRKS